jgi:DNA-binding NarL/FixJ family response regulator
VTAQLIAPAPCAHLMACPQCRRRTGAEVLARHKAERALAAINAPPDPNEERPSARELQVVQLAAQGMDLHEMAAELELSPQTVKSHLRRARGKAGARNTANLIALCLRRRWIK